MTSWDSSETILPPLIKTVVAGIGNNIHLAFLRFLGRLGDLAAPQLPSCPLLGWPHSNCRFHVTCSKKAQGTRVRKLLKTHGLARNHINDGSITKFQEFGAIFQLFPRAMINLLLQLSKFASNMNCVTIQHRGLSSTDLAWMVQNNHLSWEASCFHWWVILLLPATMLWRTSLADTFLTWKPTLPRKGFIQCLMVRFIRLHFSCYNAWSKGDYQARCENTSLHSTRRGSTDATNFIDILAGQIQGLVKWASWWQDAIQSFKQGGSTGIDIHVGDFPPLEPWHVNTWLQHLVTIPARNWHKCYCVGFVANFLNVGADSLTISSSLFWL